MEKLHNVDNMLRCIDQFHKYMLSAHSLDILSDFPMINPRKVMFDTMSQIKEDPELDDLPLKTLNNITLNKMRDYFVERANASTRNSKNTSKNKSHPVVSHHLHQNKQRPNPRVLEREKLLYGDRPMLDADRLPIPMNSNTIDDLDPFGTDTKKLTETQFDHLSKQRENEFEKEKPDMRGLPQIQENKISIDDFQLQLARMKEEREDFEGIEGFEEKREDQGKKPRQMGVPKQNNTSDLYDDSHALNPRSNHGFEMFEESKIMDIEDRPRIQVAGDTISDEPINNVTTKTNFQGFYRDPAPRYIDEREQTKKFPTITYISPAHHITFNGYDRDWVKQRARFKFTIDTTNLKKTYKNITEVSFPRIIIPAEVFDTRSIQNPMPKMNYTHKFSLAVPYIMLIVDELVDVSDGVNAANQSAFANYVHDCTFNTENGRGYHIMKSMQDETKIFHPTVLASLPRLNFTIAKPNGIPFNQSKDNYFIWKIEYPEYNRPYLKIVLDKFFDKNEFFKGDSIYVKNFRIPVFDRELVQANDEAGIPHTDPAYLEYLENAYTFNRIMEFMNRPEGHDILEVDKPNAEGFSRAFMIHAPGSIDAENGRFVINKQMVDLIKQKSKNEAHGHECDDNSHSSPIKSGDLINVSLQVVVSMRIKTFLGDSDNLSTRDLI